MKVNMRQGKIGGRTKAISAVVFMALLVFVATLSGCSPKGDDTKSAVATDSSAASSTPAENPSKGYSKALAKFFPQDQSLEYYYHGYAEYGHRLHFVSAKEEEGKLTLRYEGVVDDGYGESHKDRSFSITYFIDDQKVVQQIKNEDTLRTQKKEGTLESLISEKIVLQLPLKKGNSWTQTFTKDNKEYTATSTIVSEGTTPQGKAYYEVKTNVPDMKEYRGGVYQEGTAIEEGMGVISFYHSIPEKAVQLSSGVIPTDDMYQFGFSFTQIQPLNIEKK